MRFDLEYADGTKREVRIFMSDLVEYEEHFGKPSSGLGKSSPLSELLYVVWAAESREGNTGLPFDDWRKLGVDATDADPKAPAAVGNRAQRRAPRKKS